MTSFLQSVYIKNFKYVNVFFNPFSLAVLVYLNYKNAYEHWNEQRLALNKEVGTLWMYTLLFHGEDL